MGNAQIKPADPGAIFLPFQARWVADTSRIKQWEKSRQIGASWATAYAADERTAMKGARFDQWVSSRDDIQAQLFIADCKMFAQVLKVAAEDLGEKVIDPEKRITARVLKFANGRSINSMSSNPDAQAGKRGGRILDEFALHPDPRKLWTIAYPGITWGGALEVISTHRGSGNFFNEIIQEVRERGNPKNISLHRTTLQDALDQGFLWKLQQVLPKDDERQAMTEPDYFDWVKSGCADEESFQQEYMCNPANDGAAFLEYDLIAGCEYPAGEKWEVEAYEVLETSQVVSGRELYAGVDIGRKKDLTVLWVVERAGDVLRTRKVETLKNMRKSDQEKVLYPWFAACRRTCIDNTGLGIGWTDDAQDKFGAHKIEGVNFSGPVKEALAYPLRGAFEDKKVRIPYDRHIRADLRKIKKTVTAAGNIRFEADSDADGHADRFWALALAIHAAGKPTGPIEHRSIAQRRFAARGTL
jgi:phage FluMu gp28-like protein